MSGALRYRDWPVRVKVVALLALCSVIPLALSSYVDTRQATRRVYEQGAALLESRADQLAYKLDTLNRGYLRSVTELAALPTMAEFAGEPPDAMHATAAQAILTAYPTDDVSVRGVGILNATGRVIAATEPALLGRLIERPFVRDAIRGTSSISDVHVAGEVGEVPSIAYAAPIEAAGRVVGVAVLWVRAKAMWDIARTSNELAGARSYAVVLDQDGIRIAHTYTDEVLFHPAGALDPTAADAMIHEARFGARTVHLLGDLRPFPEQFALARAPAPSRGLFKGFAPATRQITYGVARRLETAPWTAFYMIPEDTLEAPIAGLVRDKLLLTGAIIGLALVFGAMLARSILRSVGVLARATQQLAAGDLTARAAIADRDELGQLAASFNEMAARLEDQAASLREHRDQLENRVIERTAQLDQAKTSAEQSEQSLAITLDSIGDGVIATDTEGRITRMNPVAQQLTGWSFAEARDQPLREVFRIVNETTRDEIESPVHAVLRHGTIVGLANHTALISRDGTERAIADSGAPIRDAAGELRGVVLVFRDQTEQRDAERRLRASEARTAAVIEAALDAILVMDQDGRIVDLNPAGVELFGYARDEAIGKLLEDVVIPPALREAHRQGLARYRETEQPRILGRRLELPARRRDGTEFPAEITVVRSGLSGAPLFTGYIRDITERKRAAEVEAMRRSKEAAEAANVELEAFSYTVAHDLRGPLRAINGFSRAVIEDCGPRLDADSHDHLERIARAANRMGELIDGLLALARIAKSGLQQARVDLTALSQTIIASLDSSAREVEWRFAPGVTAHGDPRLLRSLMENLLGNAWKFTVHARPAQIELGTTVEDGARIYYVRDNGVGFDMAHSGRLFTPFQRLHNAADFEGTGIGLATSERIVRRHGGRIWVESKPGKGSTFYFTLGASRSTRELPTLAI